MGRVTIRLWGPFNVTGPNHEDLTPAGSKPAALLALLAGVNGRRVSREWLRQMLWSDRLPEQGNDSLRHAISKLRLALGPYKSIIKSASGTLALDRELTLIDLFDKIPAADLARVPDHFLMGLDVKDREFNDWLHGMRLNLADPATARRPAAPGLQEEQCGICIGLMPVQSVGPDTAAQVVGLTMLQRLGASLANLGPFSLYDFSGNMTQSLNPLNGPGALLSLRCVEMGDCFAISGSLKRAADDKILWSRFLTVSTAEASGDRMTGLIIELTDQIASVLSHPGMLEPNDRHKAARLVLGALGSMFSPSNDRLNETEIALKQATELETRGVYFAWRAYFLIYRFEELKGQGVVKDIKAQANELADKALKLEGTNPLTLALLTHVYAFIFRDFTRAQTLIEPALAMNADSLMAQDSYALLNFYTGNMEEARQAATRVFNQSLYHPLRYCFATSLCMIETVSENYQAAAEFGELALAMHPPASNRKYLPALRYLATAQACAGNQERASEVFSMLRDQDPSFNVEAIGSSDFPAPNSSAASLLKRNLNRLQDSESEN